MALDFNEFLTLLEAKASKGDGVFTQKELTPVVLSGSPPPGESAQGGLPPSKTGPVEIEVIQVDKPKKGNSSSQPSDVKVKNVIDKSESGSKSKKDKEGEKGEGDEESSSSSGSGEGDEESSKTKSGSGSGAGSESEGEPKDSEANITKREEKIPGEKSGKKDKSHPWGKTIDSHEILNTSDQEEAKEIGQKILELGEKRRQEEGGTEYGSEEGGYLGKLREAYKPKINWVNELKKKLTEFKSRTANTFNRFSKSFSDRYHEGEGSLKSKSYLQWLRNPRSHSKTPGGQLISPGPSQKSPYNEAALIIALDTSGSVPESTIGKVFAEMDKIAQSFKAGISTGTVKLTGKVYFMMWDASVEGVEEYKPGDWKKYKEGGTNAVKGFGGTDPGVVFKYINDHIYYDKENMKGAALLNLIKKPNAFSIDKDTIVLPMKGGDDPHLAVTPFLIIATDGYFAKVQEQDLGFAFKDNHKNVLWLIIDGSTDAIYPDNAIVYETVRV